MVGGLGPCGAYKYCDALHTSLPAACTHAWTRSKRLPYVHTVHSVHTVHTCTRLTTAASLVFLTI